MRLPLFVRLTGLHPYPCGVEDTVVDQSAAMAIRAQHGGTQDTFFARPQTFNRPLWPYIVRIDHELHRRRFQRLKLLAEQEVFALDIDRRVPVVGALLHPPDFERAIGPPDL